MLILEFNSEYNQIKVAGGTVADITRKAESLLSAAKKNSITTYFYYFLFE
jgi:hypothetical protein